MKGLIFAYNNLKLQSKLIIAFTIVAFLPLIFVGVFLTTQMKAMALQESIKDAETNLLRVVYEIEELIEFNDTLHSAIISDSDMYPAITTDYESPLDIFFSYKAYSKMTSFEEMYEGVDDIRIYAENPTMLNNMDFMKTTVKDQQQIWYKKALEGKGASYAGYYYDAVNKKDYLALSRSFEYGNNNFGVILTLISVGEFMDMIAYEEVPFQIIDGRGYVVASQDMNDIGMTSLNAGGLQVDDKGHFWKDTYKNEESQLIQEELTMNRLSNSLHVVAAIPLDEILANANAASTLGYTVMIISLVTTMAFIYLFTNLLSKRLKTLKKSVKRVADGHFDAVQVLEGEDEIGELSKNLDIMAKSINDLMEDNEVMHKKEKEFLLASEQTRFELLANQINPHFLFNVLEAIRMKAHIEGEDDISDVVQLLGKLMRRSLEMTNDHITLAEELDFVESYIKIQKFRFGDRFAYKTEVETGLLSCQTLPLLLQPIVENAVAHGLEGKPTGGLVSVAITKDHNDLRLTVSDNGCGIDKDRLDDIKKRMGSGVKTSKHIGIANVHERLRLKYGDAYGLDIKSELAKGTSVTIRMPILGESDGKI